MTEREAEFGWISRVRYRICYEDTDAAGVVYYANYLRYMERGRNEFLRDLGTSVRQLQERGILFPVVAVEMQFRLPAFLDDDLVIESSMEKIGRGSILFHQKIFREREDEILVEGRVKVACVGSDLKPRRLPEEIRKLKVES